MVKKQLKKGSYFLFFSPWINISRNVILNLSSCISFSSLIFQLLSWISASFLFLPLYIYQLIVCLLELEHCLDRIQVFTSNSAFEICIQYFTNRLFNRISSEPVLILYQLFLLLCESFDIEHSWRFLV